MRQIATWKRPKTFKMVKQRLITNRQKDKVLCAELGKRKQESKKKSTYETTLSIKKNVREERLRSSEFALDIKKKSMMEEKTIKAKKIRARPEKKGFYFKRIKIVFFNCRFEH